MPLEPAHPFIFLLGTSTVKLALLGYALSHDFITEGRSLILHGKSGRGRGANAARQVF